MIVRFLAEEKFWLERRIELLEKMDDIAQEYYDNDRDIEDVDNDLRLECLSKEYSNVETPYALSQTIRKIYPPHQYGDTSSKKSKKKK